MSFPFILEGEQRFFFFLLLHKLVHVLLRCEKMFAHTRSLGTSKNKTIKRKRENRSVSYTKRIRLRSFGEKEFVVQPRGAETLQSERPPPRPLRSLARSLVGQPYK